MPEDIEGCVEYEEFQELFRIIPVALTAEQIAEHNPPPNPAKMADPRSGDYVDKHGTVSYEVDALKPEVLNQLLDDAIRKLIDIDAWERSRAQQETEKAALKKAIEDIDLHHYIDRIRRIDEEE